METASVVRVSVEHKEQDALETAVEEIHGSVHQARGDVGTVAEMEHGFEVNKKYVANSITTLADQVETAATACVTVKRFVMVLQLPVEIAAATSIAVEPTEQEVPEIAKEETAVSVDHPVMVERL